MRRTLVAGACLFLFSTMSQGGQDQDKQAAPDSGAASGAPQRPALALKGVQIGGLWYISFQYGKQYAGSPESLQSYSQFRIKRGYIDISTQLQPWLDVRVTPDVTQDSTGDVKVRIKYLYARFRGEGTRILNKPYLQFGVVHMPWLDFEEKVNRFRMQDTMFLERNELFNSADTGFIAGSNFGPELSEEYRSNVNGSYAGRYGSWQFGVYNGGGYHARENNRNKVVEGRATMRPVPAGLPGLQFSLFGVYGRGNVAESVPRRTLPKYQVLAGMASYEHARVVLTAQWYAGKGNAAGTAVHPGTFDARSQLGSSYFVEVRFTRRRNLSAIARYDRFNTDRDDPRGDLRQRMIAGIAWQMFRNNYWLVDYDRLWHSLPGLAAEPRLQATLQISF